MGKRLILWELAGFLFVSGMGVLLHFLYEWSGGNLFAAVVSGVNESTWEHMKLFFLPTALFTAVQMFFTGRAYPNFLAVRTVSLLGGLLLIPVLFYSYSGVLGYYVDWFNISIFFLAALGMFLLDHRLLRKGKYSAPWQQVLALAVLWTLLLCFVWFTFRPPHLGLWQAPVNGTFGI